MGQKNGALLARAEKAGFNALLTLDDDIAPEQNMEGRKIAILVIKPSEQGKAPMRAMAGRILIALSALHPGEIRLVDYKDDA